MLKINTVTMEEKIDEILFKTILTNTEINQCTKELLNLFSVRISFVLKKFEEEIEGAEIDEIKSRLKDLINEY